MQNNDYPSFRNKSGFTALPGSSRSNNGSFNVVGNVGAWWTSTTQNAPWVNYRSLSFDRSDLISSTHFKVTGFSVRCVKD